MLTLFYFILFFIFYILSDITYFQWNFNYYLADLGRARNCSTNTQILFWSKAYPEEQKLRQNENCNKTVNNANNTIFISITTLICPWYPEVNPIFHPFTQFFTINSSFTNTILLITAQNCDRQRIFNKTAYVQSQHFTSAQKNLLQQSSWRSWYFLCLQKTTSLTDSATK